MLIEKKRLVFMLFMFGFLVSACGNKNIEQAEKLIESKNYDQAIDLINQEIQKNAEDAAAYYILGVAFLQKADTTKAKEAFDNTIELKNEYQTKAANKYLELGKQSLLDGNFNYSTTFFNKATELDLALSNVIVEEYFTTGKNKFGAQNVTSKLHLEEALIFYDKSGIDERDYSEIYYLLGYLEYVMGNFNQAIDLFTKFEGRYPNHLGNRSLLADCNLLAENFELAIQKYEKLYETISLEENWFDPFSSASEIEGEGSFIVKIDNANVYSIRTNKTTGTLNKYDIFPYHKIDDGKLLFTDTKNKVYIASEGWVADEMEIDTYDRKYYTEMPYIWSFIEPNNYSPFVMQAHNILPKVLYPKTGV